MKSLYKLPGMTLHTALKKPWPVSFVVKCFFPAAGVFDSYDMNISLCTEALYTSQVYASFLVPVQTRAHPSAYSNVSFYICIAYISMHMDRLHVEFDQCN